MSNRGKENPASTSMANYVNKVPPIGVESTQSPNSVPKLLANKMRIFNLSREEAMRLFGYKPSDIIPDCPKENGKLTPHSAKKIPG